MTTQEDSQRQTASAGVAPSETPLRLYGSMDGGRVQTRAATGEKQPWRELKTGAWYQARGNPPAHPGGEWQIRAYDITYQADICPADEFGELFWSQGVARGAEKAAELIIIGNGARWIWEQVDLHFPHAIQIVDWFHACEYLAPVAKQAFDDRTQQVTWINRIRDALWHGDLDTVISACQEHVQPQLPARDNAAQQAVTYYSNNRHRMAYATYRDNGYQIGSRRMKVSGARWNVESARLVAKARAAFLSDQGENLATRREHLSKVA